MASILLLLYSIAIQHNFEEAIDLAYRCDLRLLSRRQVVQTKQLGEINTVKLILEAMQAGLYFSQRFIDSVLRYVGEG